MKPLRVALLAAAAAFAIIPSAIAADLGGGPPRRSMKDVPYAAPSVFSWTGFYIGTHLGYGWSDVDWQGVSNSLGGSGALAGGQIGYNWQKGALVYGLEADASSSWVDGSTSGFGHSVDWAMSHARPPRRRLQRQPHDAVRNGRRRLGRHRLQLAGASAAIPRRTSAG